MSTAMEGPQGTPQVLTHLSTTATLAQLKKALPDSTAEFREECLELEASLADAQGLWMKELHQRAAAQEQRIAELSAAAKAPGVAPVAASTGSTGPTDEEGLIAEAVQAAGGNYRKGLETLQRRLMKPHQEAGLTTASAQARCLEEYPAIFGRHTIAA